MDFLRLSRSRSGSSGNKKGRSPLPSPSRPQSSSGGGEQQASFAGPSHAGHASDQAQRARKGSSNSNNTNMSSIAAMIKSTSTSADLASSSKSNAQPQHGLLSQPIECTFPSLLSPPNPAFVSGSEARGILINARRPSLQEGMVQTRSADFATTIPAKRSSNALAPRPPHLRGSVSSDSVLKASTTTSTSASTTETEERGRGRIRFAPLPDPRRPRSYSTGRDIWFDGDSENHVHINTRDMTEVTPSSWSSSGSGKVGPGSMNGTSAQSNSLAMSLGDSLNDAYPLSPSISESKHAHKRTSSTLAKLLQPLKLGRAKSRESDKSHSPDSDSNRLSLSLSASPSTSLAHWMNGGEPLSRSISTGAGSADIERQRKEEFKSSGVPLIKSSTTESIKKQQPTRRILYPSVAQGGVRKRDIKILQPVKEPEFVEWTNPSARTGMNGAQQDDDDDGTGMAWLKKRRAERERKAKEEAAEAPATVKSTDSDAEQSQKSEANEAIQNVSIAKEDASTMLGEGQAMPGIIVEDAEAKASVNNDQPEVEMQGDTASEGKSSDEGAEQNESPQEKDEDEDEDDSNSDSGDEEELHDDLTAAEIEEEERLAEEARRTTGGASRELYHSHEHQSSTYTFDAAPAPQRRVSSRSNSLNTPSNFERNVSYSSFKSDMPRSLANSHPGDWPVIDHGVVPPC